MNATVTWHEALSFTGGAEDSGFTVKLGGGPHPTPEADGLRPMELILIGLIGCTGMDVISILEKKRQNIVSFDVKAFADRSKEHPKVFTHIRVHYIVRGPDVDPKAVERAIELSKDKYCPASAMLSQTVDIEHTYEVVQVPAMAAGIVDEVIIP